MSDARAVAARMHHQDAERSSRQAGAHRRMRDRLILQLRREDPQHWSYPRLARAVGCSPELIAHIVRQDSGISPVTKGVRSGTTREAEVQEGFQGG